MEKIEILYFNIAGELGDDVMYITAQDEEAHLDPPTLAFSFVGLLVLSFCAGFFEAMRKDANKLGDRAWQFLKTSLSQATQATPSTDNENLANQKQLVLETFEILKTEVVRLDQQDKIKYVQAGQDRVVSRLKTYHFSEIRISQISIATTKQIIGNIEAH